MRRKLVNFFTALSLALCVATAMLRGRSCFVADWIAHSTEDGFRWNVVSQDGRLGFWYQTIIEGRVSHTTWERRPAGNGFEMRPSSIDRVVVDVTCLHAFLWTAALPVGRLLLRRFPQLAAVRLDSPGSRRRGRGLRPRCGYYLRATPGRCPECGTVVTTQIRRTWVMRPLLRLLLFHCLASYAWWMLAVAIFWLERPGGFGLSDPVVFLLAVAAAPATAPWGMFLILSYAHMHRPLALLGFGLSYWAPLVGLLLWDGRAPKAKRWMAGLCPICGYDLRASRGRCPECGTKLPPRPEKPT